MNGMDEWQAIQNEKIRLMKTVEDAIAQKDAEIARLRRALEQIAWETVDDVPPYLEMDRWQMSVVARRALTPSNGTRGTEAQ